VRRCKREYGAAGLQRGERASREQVCVHTNRPRSVTSASEVAVWRPRGDRERSATGRRVRAGAWHAPAGKRKRAPHRRQTGEGEGRDRQARARAGGQGGRRWPGRCKWLGGRVCGPGGYRAGAASAVLRAGGGAQHHARAGEGQGGHVRARDCGQAQERAGKCGQGQEGAQVWAWARTQARTHAGGG
jgi:hypothetical protein